MRRRYASPEQKEKRFKRRLNSLFKEFGIENLTQMVFRTENGEIIYM